MQYVNPVASTNFDCGRPVNRGEFYSSEVVEILASSHTLATSLKSQLR